MDAVAPGEPVLSNLINGFACVLGGVLKAAKKGNEALLRQLSKRKWAKQDVECRTEVMEWTPWHVACR